MYPKVVTGKISVIFFLVINAKLWDYRNRATISFKKMMFVFTFSYN